MSRISKQANCLNLFRLFAALNVFYGHAIQHLEITKTFRGLGVLLGFFLGVPTFFFLSGFLIWMSIERSHSFKDYVKKRIFRLYPELWVAVAIELLTIVVFYKEPINYPALGFFGITQASFLQFWTPGFLRGYGCGTPNGSLWTICVTVQFYLVAWWIHKWLKNKRMYVWIIFFGLSLFFAFARPIVGSFLPEVLDKLFGQTLIPYFWIFLIGCFAAKWFDCYIDALKKYWYVFLTIAIVWYAIGSFDIVLDYYPLVRSVLFFACMLGFAYGFPGINIGLDISYGLYIYHMIIINVMIELDYIGDNVYLLAALFVTVVFGVLSTVTIGRFGMKKRVTMFIQQEDIMKQGEGD